MLRGKAPTTRVTYSAHFWRTAWTDTLTWAARHRAGVAVAGLVIFFVVAFFAWLARGAESEFLASILAGAVALLVMAGGIFAAHWLYLTPRNLCAAKQNQLDAERRKFTAALEKERQSAQIAITERDVLKSKLEARPLRPLELRQEIDQLLAEGNALLDSMENTMAGEAEMWFDDVERFAHRHLSPKQYDQLHDAAPPDAAEQVQLHRARAGEEPIPEEEFAIAERLVRVSAGLREIRQGLTAETPGRREK
jgi:hypothetical protein